VWYRSQKQNIERQKHIFRDYVVGYGFWVLPTNTASSVLAYLNAQTNTPTKYTATNMAVMSVAAWLAYSKLPTNFLDYTPYRGLDGVGPFTYDPTVGHPHGWTNAYTVAGGTNYPAGRTNWYTTDYGWDGLRHLTTNFIVQIDRNSGNIGRSWASISGWSWADEGIFTNWVDVEASFLTFNTQTNNSSRNYHIFKQANRGTQPPEESQKLQEGISALLAGSYSISTNSSIPAVSPLFPTLTAQPAQYLRTNYTEYITAITYPYGDFGLGYTNVGSFFTPVTSTNGGYYGWQSGSSLQASNYVSVAAGSTNMPTLAGYPVDPPGFNGASQVADGFRFADFYISFWNFDNGTNGFKYR
jgi:hypothetical protein